MIYTFSLTIPLNTTNLLPASVELAIGPGIVRQLFMTFPDNCGGLVGLRVKVRERVLWPTNPDTWLVNNDYTFAFQESLEITPDPEVFTLEGYNLDELQDKEVWMTLVVLPPEPIGLSALLSFQPGATVEGGLVIG